MTSKTQTVKFEAYMTCDDIGGFKSLFDSLGGTKISINLSAGAPKNKPLKAKDIHELAKNIQNGKSLFFFSYC